MISKEIIESIIETYVDLKTPLFFKINARFEQGMWSPLLAELKGYAVIIEMTNLSCDVSRVFEFHENGVATLTLKLSLVGSFGIIYRMNSDAADIFVSCLEETQTETERAVVQLLKRNGVRLLGLAQLNHPIDLHLFDTADEYVRVYQALFSDVEFLPGEYNRKGLVWRSGD